MTAVILVRNITGMGFFQNSVFAIFDVQIVRIMITDFTQYIGYSFTFPMKCYNFLQGEY